MADISKIPTLPAFDMVGDERRTWYVVEWKNDQGDPDCYVGSAPEYRARIVASLNANESEMVQYSILAPIGTDAEEVLGYVTGGNSRLS